MGCCDCSCHPSPRCLSRSCCCCCPCCRLCCRCPSRCWCCCPCCCWLCCCPRCCLSWLCWSCCCPSCCCHPLNFSQLKWQILRKLPHQTKQPAVQPKATVYLFIVQTVSVQKAHFP